MPFLCFFNEKCYKKNYCKILYIGNMFNIRLHYCNYGLHCAHWPCDTTMQFSDNNKTRNMVYGFNTHKLQKCFLIEVDLWDLIISGVLVFVFSFYHFVWKLFVSTRDGKSHCTARIKFVMHSLFAISAIQISFFFY